MPSDGAVAGENVLQVCSTSLVCASADPSLRPQYDIDVGCLSSINFALDQRSEDHGRPPVSTLVPTQAQAQQQEVAVLARQLHDAHDRIHALEHAAAEQQHAYAGNLTALQRKISTLQTYIAAREADMDRVNHDLRTFHHDLDQTIRETTSEINVGPPSLLTHGLM